MKASLFAVPVLLALITACSGGDNPTDPDPDPGPGETPGGNNGGGGGNTVTGPDTVYLNGATFSPSSLTISPGDTVVWVQQDQQTHTVTPQGHSAFSRVQSSTTGVILRVVFNNAGSFPYFCEPHASAGMTGTITVQ